jgi:hypothetical protein
MTSSIRNVVGYGVARPRVDATLRNIVGYAVVDKSGVVPPVLQRHDYLKTEKDLVMDLIKESNPVFASLYQPGSITFGALNAIAPTPTNPDDTSVRVAPAPGTEIFSGTRLLTYRRVDLTKLFRGRVVEISKYSTANTLAYADMLELIRTQLGVNIDTASMTAAALTVDTARTFAIAATSLAYKGSITVIWRKPKRDLSDMFADLILDGRQWPQGFIGQGDGAKPQGEYIAYDMDFTGTVAAGQFAGWPIGGLTGAGSSANVTTANFRELMPNIDWSATADYTVPGGWMGLTIQRYTLPNAAVPEANQAYNRCLTLTPPAGKTAWFYGKLMFHWRA